ncbi:MAG: hypothetical protein AAFN13_14290, partial [Bacteroidota bacterium]
MRAFLLLLAAFTLAACSSPITPEAEPVGLFDDVEYLPALSSAQAADWQFLQPSRHCIPLGWRNCQSAAWA